MKNRVLLLLLALLLALPCVSAWAEPVEQLAEPIAQLPILLTSVGQSADVEMVRVMLEKASIACAMEKLATSENLGDNKTLILAVGGSSKGLGAAGIDADQELARASELVKAANEAGITIIALHVGGAARRGDLSDRFIPAAFEFASYAIVVEDGDKDGMMKDLATEAGTPFTYCKSMAACVDPLKAAIATE